MSLKDYRSQRARQLEHRFVWLIVSLVVLVNLCVIVPAASAAECINARYEACEYLLGAEVFFERVTADRFIELCGPEADACAKVSITRRVCTIYYAHHVLDAHVVEHEMNHCRGWFHIGETKSAYRRPWVDYTTYLGG